jgi:hypothetical protein
LATVETDGFSFSAVRPTICKGTDEDVVRERPRDDAWIGGQLHRFGVYRW